LFVATAYWYTYLRRPERDAAVGTVQETASSQV
jgi:hypothetical protein